MTEPANETLILICEESHPYYQMESHLLSRHGYYALSVSETAIVDEVQKQMPKLLILGLTAKGAPLEVVLDLRTDPATRRVSVLATGIRGHITRAEILSRGANGLLWKPFSPDRFIREVDRLANIPERLGVKFNVHLKKKRPRARAIKGTSVNFSETGILVWAERSLELGDIYVVEGSVTRGGFALDARVVRHATELGPKFYALNFKQEPDEVRQAISALDIVNG